MSRDAGLRDLRARACRNHTFGVVSDFPGAVGQVVLQALQSLGSQQYRDLSLF